MNELDTDGLRIIVEYKIGGKWFRQLRKFTEYEPLVVSDFSEMAGNTCALMINEIIKEYNNE